ncbi:hypothetical protein GCM10010446_41590 [Streptomyces enissocaesilis]|uniref:SDR family oxidoreductase n=1 Tax=Streptomyces enissocaesilis TaxID=332589 RepID=A0ABN3XHZ0_9ACTN
MEHPGDAGADGGLLAQGARREAPVPLAVQAHGIVDTDINAAGCARAARRGPGRRRCRVGSGRVGEPSGITDVVAFLASDDARRITGRWLDATGGPLAREGAEGDGGGRRGTAKR